MTRLVWGEKGQRTHEAGLDRGVFYPRASAGLAWDGLISVDTIAVDLSSSRRYFDGQTYHNQELSDSFAGRIEAFTYPADLSQPFDFSFRTSYSNEHGSIFYKIHLVYNVVAVPSASDFSTLDDDPDSVSFAWDFFTTPEQIPYGRPSAHLVIDSAVAYPESLLAFESVLYGTSETEPTLPTVTDVLAQFEEYSILKITDNGDGTWTAEGPDDVVFMLDDTTFQISWPSAVYIDDNTYRLSSL